MRRNVLAAAVAVLFAGAAQAAVTEFIVYKQPDFRGDSKVVKGEVAHLEDGFAREGSSLVVKGGFWEVCTGDHFKGDCHVIAAGEYPRLGRLDDRIIAVRFLGTDEKHARRVDREIFAEARADRRDEWRERRDRADRRDWRDRDDRDDRRWSEWRDRRDWRGDIALYGGREFRGRSVNFDENVRDLRGERFDGRASSVIVHEGTWQLCTEPGYRGRCSVLRPGQYPQLAMLDDRVSSIRRLY